MAAVRSRYEATSATLTDSGTTALTAVLRVLAKHSSPGPVALPAFGCFDLATAAVGAGVAVLLYDLDPATLGPDLESLRAVLREGVSAVVAAHLYGLPADVPAVRSVAAEAGAFVVEDAAQAADAWWGDRRVGALASVSILSFGRGKGTTAGRGGAILAFDPEGEQAAGRATAELGQSRPGWDEPAKLALQWLLGRPALYSIPSSLPFLHLGETIYRPPGPMRGMSAVGRAALERTLALADEEAATRRANAEWLLKAIVGREGLTPPLVAPRVRPGYLRLPLRASVGYRRRAAEAPARRLGIMPAYPRGLWTLPGFADRCRNAGAGFKGARELVESLVTLPTHSLLTTEDRRRLVRWVEVGA